jgi:glutaminyl-peptide cyclotransferase
MKGFVGASDGASSAAFLIELARVLKDQPREFTYEFVWFDGEEAVVNWVPHVDSTYGSRYYVQAAKRAPGALAQIKAMILIDMIGDKNLTLRREQNSTPWLKDAIWGTAKKLGHGNVFMDEETPIEDDHLEFAKEGIPTVDIIDLDYDCCWHKVEDNLSAVSARSLQIVGDVLLAALPEISKRAVTGK